MYITSLLCTFCFFNNCSLSFKTYNMCYCVLWCGQCSATFYFLWWDNKVILNLECVLCVLECNNVWICVFCNACSKACVSGGCHVYFILLFVSTFKIKKIRINYAKERKTTRPKKKKKKMSAHEDVRNFSSPQCLRQSYSGLAQRLQNAEQFQIFRS